MKIGIYIEVVKASEKTGISRYVIGLINALSKIDTENEYLLYFQSPFFGEVPSFELELADNFNLRPVRFPLKWMNERPRLWWNYYLPFILDKDKIDVFHGPNHFIPSRGKFKKIVTIHDIAYFYMNVHGKGMDRVLEDWTRISFEAADKVITVSKSTARDCIKEGVLADKVETIYQGYESSFEHLKLTNQEKNQVVKKMQLPEKCILFLGSLQPRKNLEFLVSAFSLIAEDTPHHLILAGAPGSSSEELHKQVVRLGINDRVIFTGYIDDKERAALYQHSELFVYPSKYEGFGLVLLEAMSFGIPVITTNVSSLPEVVEDAGSIVELDSAEELANSIKQILNDTELKQSYINKGLKRSKQFKWEESARNTLKSYLSL